MHMRIPSVLVSAMCGVWNRAIGEAKKFFRVVLQFFLPNFRALFLSKLSSVTMFDFTPGQTLATDDSTETQFGWSGNPSCNAAAPFSANGSSSLFSFDSPVMPPAHEYTAILSAKNTMPEEGASLGTPTATQTSSYSVQSQERQDPARMQTLECADLSLPMPMDVDTPLLQGEFELQGQTAGRTSEPLHASNDPITKKPPLHSKGSAPLQIKLPDFSQSRLIAPGPGIRKQVAQLSKDVNPLANRAPEVVGRSPTPKSIDLAIRSSTTRTLIAQPRSPFSPKKTSTLSSSASPAATSSLSQNEIGCMLTGDLEEKKQKRKAERYFVHLCSINPGEVSVLQCLKPKYRGQ